MSDIFVSYASEDRDRVEPLAKALEKKGWSVWWDRHIPTGGSFDEVIEEALDQATVVIVVWTHTSVKSYWVKNEAREGLNRHVLCPVMLDNVKMPLEFRHQQTAQLENWQGASDHPALHKLFEDLYKKLVEGGFQEKTQPNRFQSEPDGTSTLVQPVLAIPNDMVFIPKGSFLYGEDKQSITIDYEYFMDVYPVTNEKYRLFIQAKGYDDQTLWSLEGWAWKTKGKVMKPEFWDVSKWNIPVHPVVGVSFYEVEAYATWVGKRLPTEQEWEKAARGTKGVNYPWGNDFDKTKCNSNESHIGATSPVTKFTNGKSPFGCHDMAGNVCEWTTPCEDREDPVVRGGSWSNNAGLLRLAYRYWLDPWFRNSTVGFRCAQNAKEE